MRITRCWILVSLFLFTACDDSCDNGGLVVGKWEHTYSTHTKVGKVPITNYHHDYIIALQRGRNEPTKCRVSKGAYSRYSYGSIIQPTNRDEEQTHARR